MTDRKEKQRVRQRQRRQETAEERRVRESREQAERLDAWVAEHPVFSWDMMTGNMCAGFASHEKSWILDLIEERAYAQGDVKTAYKVGRWNKICGLGYDLMELEARKWNSYLRGTSGKDDDAWYAENIGEITADYCDILDAMQDFDVRLDAEFDELEDKQTAA